MSQPAITAKQLKAIAPQAKDSIIGPVAVAMTAMFPLAKINTERRVQHFLAQAAHETDGFRTLVEYWGPTAAQKGYEGRADLGNVKKGDGKLFMGRGIFQLTGRANYRTIGAKLGMPLEAKPHMASDPANSVEIACEYWNSRKISPKADKDDGTSEGSEKALRAVTKAINGGYNGLDDRRKYLSRAKSTIRWPIFADPKPETRVGPQPESPTGGPPATNPVGEDQTILTPASGEELIRALQRLLTEKNYGKLNPDGDWGELTSMAVVALQTANQLPLNGVAINWADAKNAKVFISEARKDLTMSEVAATPTEAGKEINKTTLVQAGAGAVGVVGAGEKTGFFDWVGSMTEKIGILQPAVEGFSRLWEFASSNLGWIAVGGAVGIFFLARNSKFKILEAFKRGD